MKRRPRKIITRVIVFLLLGAIVNVAVAWGFAANSTTIPFVSNLTWDIGTLVDFDKGNVGIGYTDLMGISEVQWWADTGGFFPRDGWTQKEVFPSWLPRWTTVQRIEVTDHGDFRVTQVASGLPVRALMSEFRESYIIDLDDTRICRWHCSVPMGRSAKRALPLRPLWPGFAINTIFYAAILWPLFTAPGFIRRRRRIKRGLCPACAYPVGGSPVCTECGAAVTKTKPRRGDGM